MFVSEGTCCSGAGGATRTLSLSLLHDSVSPATHKQTLGKCPFFFISLPLALSPPSVPGTETLWYSDGGAFDHEPKGQI